MVNRVTGKSIIKILPNQEPLSIIWTHKIKFCKPNLYFVVASIGD